MLADVLHHPQGFPIRFMGIILGDNPSRHCFILTDLFPISFFRLVMIMLLKICAADKIFSKIFLKAIRATFFSNMWCDQGREWGLGVISNRKGKFKLLVFQGDPLPQFPPLVWHPDLSIRKILRSDRSAYCNDFEKHFLSKQQIYSM